MTFVRHYIMTTSAERTDALGAALAALRDAVVTMDGSLRVDLLRDLDAPGRFFFVEHWATRADHAAAGQQVPPGLTASLMALLVERPVATNLTDEAA